MPQPFKNAVITAAGADLLSRAQAGQTKILFTRIATGNGEYTEAEKEYSALYNRTALKSEKNSYNLSSIQIVTNNSVKVSVLITNMDPVTKQNVVPVGYYINEIGLFARLSDEEESEILYAVTVTEGEHGDYLPPYNGLFPSRINQGWIIAVDNASNVTVEFHDDVYALASDLAGKADNLAYDSETNKLQLRSAGKVLSEVEMTIEVINFATDEEIEEMIEEVMGSDIPIPEGDIATDEEIDEIIDDLFPDDQFGPVNNTDPGGEPTGGEGEVATDEEINEITDNLFGGDTAEAGAAEDEEEGDGPSLD